MPYITPDKRGKQTAENAGELNFQITRLILEYLTIRGECYQTYNDIMGALEGAKLELYRRKISKYEDKAMIKNGDLAGMQQEREKQND